MPRTAVHLNGEDIVILLRINKVFYHKPTSSHQLKTKHERGPSILQFYRTLTVISKTASWLSSVLFDDVAYAPSTISHLKDIRTETSQTKTYLVPRTRDSGKKNVSISGVDAPRAKTCLSCRPEIRPLDVAGPVGGRDSATAANTIATQRTWFATCV